MNGIRTLWLLLVSAAISNSQAAGVAPLFADDAPVSAVLTVPITQTYAQKRDDVRLYFPGTLSFLDAAGAKQQLEVAIRTRGLFRRINCRLPPLMLNFRKKSVAGTLFDGQDKLKLVSPCFTTRSSQQRLVLEYLTYQAFELISDKSLETRLIRMSYIDSDKRRKPWTHLTFVIEDEKDLARRHDLKAIHRPRIEPGQLNDEQAALVELFQYMIGNTDFSMLRVPEGKNCCHNMQILGKKNADTNFYPVPYDFDSSGLIDADYATPSAKLPIKDVRKRLYRGRCRSEEVMTKALERFRQRQSDILALFSTSEHLNDRYRTKSVNYLQQFFDVLADSDRIEQKITGRCRG